MGRGGVAATGCTSGTGFGALGGGALGAGALGGAAAIGVGSVAGFCV